MGIKLLLGLVVLGCIAGCAKDEPQLGQSHDEAFTLDDGQRFLVRIDGDHVVLHRTVGVRHLPWSDDEFIDKNIVIHPSSAVDGDDGLFARVVSVIDARDDLVLVVRPLELDEMANAMENGDDTLTIDRNPMLAEVPRDLDPSELADDPDLDLEGPSDDAGVGLEEADAGSDDPDLTPLSLLPRGVRPQSIGGSATAWPPTLTAAGAFGGLFNGNASAKLSGADATFKPSLSAKWIAKHGLELGASLHLATKFKLAVDATASAAKSVEKVGDANLLTVTVGGPVKLFEAPVLLGGVYSTVGVKASIGCYARVEEHFKGTLTVDFSAKVQGSLRFQASTQVDEWIQEGDMPFSAKGHANAHFDFDDPTTKISVTCNVPSINVYLQPGGKALELLGGPNLFVNTVGKLSQDWDDGTGFSLTGVAGITANPPLLGPKTAQKDLFTWKP